MQIWTLASFDSMHIACGVNSEKLFETCRQRQCWLCLVARAYKCHLHTFKLNPDLDEVCCKHGPFHSQSQNLMARKQLHFLFCWMLISTLWVEISIPQAKGSVLISSELKKSIRNRVKEYSSRAIIIKHNKKLERIDVVDGVVCDSYSYYL